MDLTRASTAGGHAVDASDVGPNGGSARPRPLPELWQKVDIGGFSYNEADQADRGSFLMVSHDEFSEMVRKQTPPPHPISLLRYSTWHVDADPLFMTQQWCDYVSTHVANVALEFGGMSPSSSVWEKALPHLAGFSLVDLRLWLDLSESDKVMSQFSCSGVSESLERLHIHVYHLGEARFGSLVIPDSVKHLLITNMQGVDLSSLPGMPKNLQTLKISVELGLDMSLLADFVPESLKTLELEVALGSQPAVISAEAASRLCPDLEHNMLVYHGAAEELDFPELQCGDYRHFGVDLLSEVDFSAFELPLGCAITVFDASDLSLRVPLLKINHWLAELDSLTLRLPLLLDGAVIPPAVEVSVRIADSDIPQEIWDIPRVVLLELRSVSAGGFPPQLALMEFLTTLTVVTKESHEATVMPAPPILEELYMNVGGAGVAPDLRSLVSLRKLRLEDVYLAARVSTEHYPPNIRTLELLSDLRDSQDSLGNPTQTTRTIDLSHLKLLEEVKLILFETLVLANVRLPDSVRSLKCVMASAIDLLATVFPPNLEQLSVVGCNLEYPWTERGESLLHGKHTLTGLPESLRLLDLSHNWSLLPPPPGFQFPPQLRHLGLSNCGISDITQFRFPEGLDLLDVGWNDLPIPRNYLWPQVSRLVVRKSCEVVDDCLDENFDMLPDEEELTSSEIAILRRLIPGVRIMDSFE